MDFKLALEKEHSKALTEKIVNEVILHPEKMKDLMDVFVKGPVQITQRAAWSISFIAEKEPSLLNNYYELFIDLLKQPNKHDSINRNILRALQFVEIPEKHQGNILDCCFNLLRSSNEPIAVKAFSMTVIYNLSLIFPEIQNELKICIEDLLPYASSGLKNRGNKILKLISK